MKKIIFSLIMVFVLITVSCSSDDDEQAENYANALIGTWKLTSILIESDLDIDNDGSASNDLLVESSNCYTNDKLVFEADQVGRAFFSSYLKVTIDSQTNEYTASCFPNVSNQPITYTATQNTVTVDNTTATLINNSQTMTFVSPNGFTIEDENSMVVLEEDASLVFTKQ